MNRVCYKCLNSRLAGIIICFFAAVAFTISLGCEDGGRKPENADITFEYSQDGKSLAVTLNRKELSVADDLEISLTAAAPAGWEIEFDKPQSEFEGFVMLGSADEKSVHDPEGKVVERVMTLTYRPEMTGDYKLPVYAVKFVKGGENAELKTEASSISVYSLIGDLSKASLKDLPGIVTLKHDYLLWYVLGAAALILGAVLLGIALIAFLRKCARYRVLSLPFYTALKNLRKLEESGSVERGEDDKVCTTASDILRKYIEERFAISASRCTTEEFLLKISDRNLLINSYSGLLQEFLCKCDEVKFAKYDASEKECRSVIESCKIFVLQTKREEINYKGEFGEIPDNSI